MQSILLVDDDVISRSWLVEALEVLPDTRLFEFESGEALIAALPRFESAVVLMDLRMPGLSGTETLAAYADRLDAFPTLLMSAAGDIGQAVAAMKLGAIDFVEKPCAAQALYAKLKPAFEQLARLKSRSTAQSEVAARFDALTDREQSVLRMLIDGHASRAIATELDLSVRTVEVYRARLMAKLGAENLADTIRLAFQAGFVEVQK